MNMSGSCSVLNCALDTLENTTYLGNYVNHRELNHKTGSAKQNKALTV